MPDTTTFLAVDLGASSGRVMVGRWDERRIGLHEIHRFGNGSVAVLEHLHWDVLRLWQEIKTGLAQYAAQSNARLAGIGIDSWAVDYGLLDARGQLLGNPHHYRDVRTMGVAQQVDQVITPERRYGLTGIQRLPFNTLYQLASMQQQGDPQLACATTLLMLPDLFHYWLTGHKVAEYTNATTTEFFLARERRWATELLAELGLPSEILPPIVQPGTVLGLLLPEIRAEVGLRHDAPVIASASHDTASAVAAIPGLDAQSAYISSGTWSLVGVELNAPILSHAAQALNFTNEGGVDGTIRFLKNVGGLWLLQESQRQWQREGQTWSWAALVSQAQAAPALRSLVDPDAPDFLQPGDMPAALRGFCARTGQPEPDSVGALVRCCLESLALKYRWVIEALEKLTGTSLTTIRIVGGGSQNEVLCQFTADACQRTVVAGPVEATALGNIMVQAIATGHIPSLAAGRAIIAASAEQTTFQPQAAAPWEIAYRQFVDLLKETPSA